MKEHNHCHQPDTDKDENAHHHGAEEHDGNIWRVAVSATIHCLVGCSIGEFIGLFIGVSMGLPVWGIITLDVTLAFISGFLLTLIPIMRYKKMSLFEAFKIIWLGETISIAVMELAMNVVDYYAGGMTVGSVMEPMFWIGFLIALPAGFIAAYPVNVWMINKNLKKCH